MSYLCSAFEKQRKYRFDSVAQQVEHIPFKDGVLGSSPSWVTKLRLPDNYFQEAFFLSSFQQKKIAPLQSRGAIFFNCPFMISLSQLT
jgi:hypothetical protein